MSEYGVVLESGAVRFERLLPGPIERVWAYLTESDKRGTWFASGEADLRVGGRIALKFRHAQITSETPPERFREMNDKGFLSPGTITHCEPPHLLAFRWAEAGEPGSDVEFALTPVGDKVRLVLTHRNISSKTQFTNVSGGWQAHLGILEDLLSGTSPRGFWSNHGRLEAEYKERYAAMPDWGPSPAAAGE